MLNRIVRISFTEIIYVSSDLLWVHFFSCPIFCGDEKWNTSPHTVTFHWSVWDDRISSSAHCFIPFTSFSMSYLPVQRTTSGFSRAAFLWSVPKLRLVLLSGKAAVLDLPCLSHGLVWLLHLHGCFRSYLFYTLLPKKISVKFEWYIVLKVLLPSVRVTLNSSWQSIEVISFHP